MEYLPKVKSSWKERKQQTPTGSVSQHSQPTINQITQKVSENVNK